jgi:hypothetical protein
VEMALLEQTPEMGHLVLLTQEAVVVVVAITVVAALVVQVSSLFATSVDNVELVGLCIPLVGIPTTNSHHLAHSQHDRWTQTSSCYVSERRIGPL